MSRLGQHDVGHEGVITGRDGFSLRSPIANPQGVAQPPLQSTLSRECVLSSVIPTLVKSQK
ncbi:hypothetical protein LSPCS325_46320 [Lysinibacillus sp. CTST325]